MGYVKRVRQQCKEIRKRLYPPEMRPDHRFIAEVQKTCSSQATMVDVGCGREAPHLHRFAKLFGMVYGVDLEVEDGQLEENIVLRRGDATGMPLPDHVADCITMTNVVEHLSDPERVFSECARVLRPGGRLVILTPNRSHPPIFLARLIPRRLREPLNVLVSDTEEGETFPAYYRANTPADLRRLAGNAGFSIIAVEYLTEHPAYFMFSPIAYRLWALFEKRVLRKEAFQFLRHFLLGVFQT